MRTIDADAFKHTISSSMCTDSITFSILLGMMNGSTNLDETTDKIVREHIKEVNRLIDNAPTVELEKLRGEWINFDDGSVACSICGTGTSIKSIPSVVFFRYCPYCGARLLKGGAEQ